MLNKVFLIVLILFLPIHLFCLDENLKPHPFKLKKKSIQKKNKLNEPLNFKVPVVEDSSDQNFTIGFKGGLQLSRFEDDEVDNGTISTYLIGFYTEYLINPYIGIEFDFFYSRKGHKLSTGTTDLKIQIDYLSFIPYLKVYPLKEYFFLGVGPSFHYRIQDRLTPSVQGVGTPFSKPIVLGLNIGLGGFFNYKNFVFSFEVRYDYGISGVFDLSKVPSDSQVYFRDIQFIGGIGVRF